MSIFGDLRREVEDGMNGKNSGIPMGFERLNNHISIRKSMLYLIGGYTGSGKTSLVDDAFVLNPMDYVLRNQDTTCNECIDMEVIYFSMERRRSFKLAKWISRKIFLDHAVILPVVKLMGWVSKDKRINRGDFELFEQYEAYIDALMTKITIIEHPQNPMGIKKFVDEYASLNGTFNKEDPYNPIYTPNNPNKITIIIYDHIGLQKGEMRDKISYQKDKEIIDLSSSDARRFRDLYGFSPVKVSQLNRSIANPMRIKNGDVEPMLEDFKDTGNVAEDADIVLSLFDPFRYKVPDPSGYSLDKLKDSEGRKKYRSLKILKNSYGSDDIRIGLAFQPEVGHFKEMPKKNVIAEQDYRDILDDSYFLRK